MIGIERSGGKVTAFTVDTEDDPVRVLIDPKIDYGFDLDHLERHRSTAEPVELEIEQRDGETYALRIVDA